MSVYKVKVKWGKEVFDKVELNTGEPPIVFKAQLFALTGVTTERQKLMFKAKLIGNEEWPDLKFADGVTMMMMGTVGEIPTAPVEKTVFIEDLSESKLNEITDYPAGLNNLGNTCYMNATVQCLKTVPELREALKKYDGTIQFGGELLHSKNITACMRDLYSVMEKGSSIAPRILLSMFHVAIPRFAEKGNGGILMQQDANEFWTEMLRMLKELKPLVDSPSAGDNEGQVVEKKTYCSFIDQYFGGTYDVTLKCTESEDELETKSSEDFLQLSCFINTDVKYLASGLKLRLQETLTKFSPSLNRDAKYLKTSKINRLPAYLSVQMVRFFYKERESISAKILKDIKFTMLLDVYELCCEELQKKLMPMRNKFKALEDHLVSSAQVADALDANNAKKPKLDEDAEKSRKRKYRYPYHFDGDVGSNNSGFYELQAVLTHKGRSSSSGHYVGWVRKSEDHWFKCDDDDVSDVTSEDILKLSGGGDWHTAYVLLYGPRVLEVDANEDGTPIEI